MSNTVHTAVCYIRYNQIMTQEKTKPRNTVNHNSQVAGMYAEDVRSR